MLSKSQYTKFVQCPRYFWIYRNDPRRLAPPSEQQQRIFDTGTRVGETAQQLFPGGEEVRFDISDVDGMARRTRELLDAGAGTIYEASFVFDDVFVAVDILHREGGFWNLYEVKSSSDVKDTYLDDVAVQAWVLENSGLELRTLNVVHINSGYVLDGELDLGALFRIRDITGRTSDRRAAVAGNVAAMKEVLAGGEPETAIGPHCLSPYECPAKDYCWRTLAGIPDESVFTLTGARRDRKFELYDSGIVNIADVPVEDCTVKQQLQVAGELHIEEEPIRGFIASLEYPVAHLDFESFQQAVPEFQGVKAYGQIPFQYSLHIESSPPGSGGGTAGVGETADGGLTADGYETADGAGGAVGASAEGRLVHREFLAPVGVDPRRELAERLLADVPPEGTVLVYNQVFEKGIIGKLAAAFEDLAPGLNALNNRILDLARPFDKRWYYHPAQNGSWSIKKVLPALVPEMADAYASLPGVKEGGAASSVWAGLPAVEDTAEVEEVRRGLLAYCRLDTLAMVKLLEVLRRV